VLTREHIRTYYRFFGARHSILQLGNLIDFEVEGEDGRFLPRLRSLSHIGFPWLFERNRLMLWHNFIQKFVPHLKDADEIDPFYFNLLLDAEEDIALMQALKPAHPKCIYAPSLPTKKILDFFRDTF